MYQVLILCSAFTSIISNLYSSPSKELVLNPFCRQGTSNLLKIVELRNSLKFSSLWQRLQSVKALYCIPIDVIGFQKLEIASSYSCQEDLTELVQTDSAFLGVKDFKKLREEEVVLRWGEKAQVG